MASMKTFFLLSAGTALATLSLVAVAQTAGNSPFSSKNKKKAWETEPVPQQQQPSRTNNGAYYTPPAPPQTPAPNYAPNYAPRPVGTYTPAAQPSAPAYKPTYKSYPSSNSARSSVAGQTSAQINTQINTQGKNTQGKNKQGGYYPGKQPTQTRSTYQNPNAQPQPQLQSGQQYGQPQYAQPQYAQGQRPQNNYQNQNGLRGASKPSWFERLGVQTSVSGHAKIGVSTLNRDNISADFSAVGDFDVRGEVSAITSGGLEYGIGLRGRAQYDKYRRGFGGRVGNCPAADPLCSGVLVGGSARAIKGHTGQFYTAGNADIKKDEYGLEGAYLFLRSSYGDVLIGRDDGSAFLFSGGAPSLLAVNASNSPVDYTGLDSVKTYNDASGFSEKVAYTSPRMLGDTVGVGVQFGVSYALDARACGVDYCVKKNTDNALDPFAPQIEDVVEFGLALDRTFSNGLKAELTGTYARGSETTDNVLFDNLQSYGFGLELGYKDFVFGTSYLNSNNAFAGDGDYTAYDAGITWKPSDWGFSASYGHAKDDIAHLTSNQGVVGVSYDLGKFRLGTGVQYINRKVPTLNSGLRERTKEEALALFVEGSVTF